MQKKTIFHRKQPPQAASRKLHHVSKNVPPLACYNIDTHEWIVIFFGINVTDKVSNQKMLYYATWNNLCFCITFQNGETRKSHFSHNWIALHTQCTCALSSWKRQELIRRWNSERELLYDDNIHVEASAYAHWTDLLISTTNIYGRPNLCT